MNRPRWQRRISILPFLVLAACTSAGPALAGAHYATSDSESAGRSDSYRKGQHALEEQHWEDAARIFGKIASGSGSEVDAALYWRAYADWKQRRKKEALEGLRRLLSSQPDSNWADDARALELEIRGAKAAKDPEQQDDEELKLYALDGLMQMDPARAVPVLEKLLAGGSSQRIKERALFVLSQSDSARAREILLRVARTGEPLDLRREAVKTLGIAGEPEDIAALGVLARDTSAPAEVREAVIEAYLIADRSDELLSIARSDPDPQLRVKAIEALGAMDAQPALRQLWATEKDPAVREKLLQAFGVAGDVEALSKAARDGSDPDLRRKAIEGLGVAGTPEAARALRELYGQFSDPDDKRSVLVGFMILGDAKTLVELFRAERDPSMKKAILQQLTVMDDPEATRVILGILGEKP